MGRNSHLEAVIVRFFKKSFLVVVVGLFVSPLLGACAAMEDWSDIPNVKNETAKEEVKVTNRLDSAPGIQPVPQFPVPGDRDLKVMTSKLSGGSVEIYDIDGGAQMAAPIGPVSVEQTPAGIPLATDPRVTVYPLDGVSTVYTPAYPQAQGWPNAVLPVGHTASGSMTPGPDAWGGDDGRGSLAIEGGKLVSRAGPNVSNIYFPYGSARLGREDSNVLSNVAETAKFAPVERVSVEGHASKPTQTNDPIKSRILNLKESMNRATAVSAELIEKGVPAEKIKTVGWGDTKGAGEGEAAQRRVDVLTGAGQ